MREDEYILVKAHLSAAQMALFKDMHRIDQRHSLDVFHTLYGAGYRDPVLLQAALLHDVGKSASRITILHRVVVVLMKKAVPGWLEGLVQDGGGWKHGLAVYASHAAISARLVQEVSSPEVVFLIAEHHNSDPQDDRLAILRWADGQN